MPGEPVTVAAADPLNLAGVVVPGERPAAVPGKTITFLGGAVQVEESGLAVTAM
jgi:ATP-dependent helicase Lhr and Lhr-like helicase